ncbi:hypothetical protein N0V93_008256 [Gnomoniopsis smithogilvyi]|uniref:White collar 1 protein n=1 Tax=Gnomoniopsis smithogilvyi TaxID=1191159 RepID=A0A9W8YMM6_9PEZI|nr:hypothetical protein N0V93_008256 [Gnomoniopsis smithogilvyi]
MSDYYVNQVSPEQVRRQLQAAQERQRQSQLAQRGTATGQPPPHNDQRSPRHQRSMMPPMQPDASIPGGDSIDDILSQNNIQRRRSIPHVPHQFSQPQPADDSHERRMSMLEFGSSNDNFQGFQFGTQMPNTGAPSTMADGMTTFGNMGNMNQPMSMQQAAGFLNTSLSMSDPASYSPISSNVMNNMMNFSNLNMGSMSSNPGMTFFNNPTMSPQFDNNMDHVSSDFAMDMNPGEASMGSTAINSRDSMGMEEDNEDRDEMMPVSQHYGSNGSGTPQQQQQQGNGTPMASYNMPPSLQQKVSNATSFHQSPTSPLSQSMAPTRTAMSSDATAIAPAPSVAAPTSPTVESSETSIYSKSGFDMIRALYYVSTRPNPEIQLGAVDFSCAFVVCDVSMNDIPIIYVSDNFQNLTGYSRHDIIGQNCRFLQAPDGNVEAGTKREFVENDAVYNLKKKIQEGRECQQGLINYRKGGKPFLNLLTMIPIPWDSKEIRYYIGFQIDLVECPDAISGSDKPGVSTVNYKHSDIGQYIWNPPQSHQWDPDSGQTLGLDDVSTLLQQFKPGAALSDWHKQSWDKMLLENTDDVVHVLSLKGLFLYLSPSCKKILEYDPSDLVGNPISSICHPSDIVPITRELKDTAVEKYVNIVFRVRRKQSGYTWFESHGSLFVEQGKGRKCIILVGRKRPVFALSRRDVLANGGIGDGELWSKLSTSGMFLFISSNVRSLLDLQPDALIGNSIQDYMRKETRPEFGRAIEKARRGKIVTCKHEIQNRRGQVLSATTVLYPGDASEGQKPTFLLAQTKLTKASSRALAPASAAGKSVSSLTGGPPEDASQPSHGSLASPSRSRTMSGTEGLQGSGIVSAAHGGGLSLGSQDVALASDDNIFEELKTTRCSSWQFELRQMEKMNRLLAEQLGTLLSNKKKRKRRKGVGNTIRDCANCHTRNTPEWRRGPSGNRDLCNSCGLRWAKQTGRVSPRTSSRGGGNGDGHSKKSTSPNNTSPLHRQLTNNTDASGGSGAIDSNSGDANRSPSTGGAAGTLGDSSGGATPSSKSMMPPPSQPMLEGGAGTGGHSMEMTSIQEEDAL